MQKKRLKFPQGIYENSEYNFSIQKKSILTFLIIYLSLG
jgi:hypothetical protein